MEPHRGAPSIYHAVIKSAQLWRLSGAKRQSRIYQKSGRNVLTVSQEGRDLDEFMVALGCGFHPPLVTVEPLSLDR